MRRPLLASSILLLSACAGGELDTPPLPPAAGESAGSPSSGSAGSTASGAAGSPHGGGAGGASGDSGKAGAAAAQSGGAAGAAAGAGGGVSKTTSFEVVCTDFWAARCAEYQSCLPAEFAVAYGSVESCTKARSGPCVDSWSGPNVNAKPEHLAGCFAAYGALGCPQFTRFLRDNSRQPDPCAAVPAGALPDGSGCNSPHECANGVCQRSPGSFCGTCASPASGFCYADADCKAEQACRGGACVPYGEAGAACDDQTPCHRDLSCVSGHCGPLLADGAACDPYTQQNPCSADYRFCSQSSNKCVAINGSQVGGSCGYSMAGDLTLCGLGGRCHITNHQSFSGSCVAAAKPGEPCTFIAGIDGGQCEAGTACVFGTCQPTAQAQCDGASPLPGGPFKTAKHVPFPQVVNGLGPVLTSLELVTVTFAGYPYAQQARALGDWVVGSAYLKETGADYGVGLGTHVKSVELASPPGSGSTVDDVDIQVWLEHQIASGALPAPPNKKKNQYLYMLYFPQAWTVTLQGQSSCQSFGGYHSGLTGKVHASYAVVNDCGQSFAEVGITASHELLEAASDPFPESNYAYSIRDPASPFTYSGGEIGDLCTPSSTVQDGFTVQRIWSNTAAATGGDPCIPALPNETYYGVTASPSDVQMAAAGQTVSFTIQGWSTAPMDDWSLFVMPGQGTFQAKSKLDKRIINNGETATLTVTIPPGTPSMSLASFTINAAQSIGGDSHAWPVAVYVP